MDKVRCGVVGVGGMGSGHCKIIPSLPEVQLTAICDIVPEVCQRISSECGVPGFTSHLELLDSGLVDMIIIATPHYFHTPIAIDAFHHGIHVLSEKPLAVTVSDADRMIQAARESGKKFGVMFQMRTNTRNIAAKRIIEEGRLGEIYRTALIMGWYRSQAYYDSGTWRATWAGEGGGVLINQAPHLLDLFTWLGGLPSQVTAQVHTRIHNIEVEDEAFAILDYPNGAHGYLYASVTEVPGEETLEICGEKGKLVIRDGKLRLWELKTPRREFTQSNTQMWASPESAEVPLDVPPGTDSHGAITSNFARAILNEEPLIAPGEEGLRAVEMINSIILSGKRAKPVSLPVDRPEYDGLIQELQKSSKLKTHVVEQRVTDPKFS